VPVLKGALAAAVTPLRDGGTQVDEGAIAPLCDFLATGGLDGVLALGTTGEGILLTVDERKLVAERFVDAGSSLDIAVHCGALTTADTVALAEHAAQIGADAVAVIGPPYFPYDDESLLAHFLAAARACAPLPFYVYEFEARSGYTVPLGVLDRLRNNAANVRGLKVSDRSWDTFERYLIEGLDAFVGPEALISRGLAAGAIGAVSAVASAYPEVVVEAVRTRSEEATRRVDDLRSGLERFPFHAALKRVLAARGVPIEEDVRAPLRGLRDDEREGLDRWLESS
jgi:dihydrodipicolinate synthase/N-acetylneuraminate lyase